MSRIAEAFQNKKAFIGFVTGGDPSLEKSEEIILKMIEAGCDLVEIGIPFSDPIAEGPVIQEANIRALAGGATTRRMFELAASIRKKSEIPLVFLTYLNPVFYYGYDRFFAECRQSGVDGIIIPDLPMEEKGEVQEASAANGVDLITLIAPTSKGRIPALVKEAAGFIYVVSSMGVTGVRDQLADGLTDTLAAIQAASPVPVAVGFGIHTKEQAVRTAAAADGVIVGSAIVKLVAKYGNQAPEKVYEYVKEMKEALAGGSY